MLLAPLLTMSIGCESDGLTPGKLVPSSELYWKLDLNHHAVTLSTTAPYDTLTLVAAPQTVDGTLLPGLPSPQYVSTDPERLTVGSDGVMHALPSSAGSQFVKVIATLTADNLKHADTVIVKIMDVDPPPVLDSFSIHPPPPDSAKVAESWPTTCFVLPTWAEVPGDCAILLPVRVLDPNGLAIAGVPVALRSSDPDLVRIDDNTSPGLIFPSQRGQVLIYASTTVFGVTKSDTLPLRIGLPVSGSTLQIHLRRDMPIDAPELTVGVGGIVTWYTEEDLAIDINFTDPANAGDLDPPPDFWPPFFVFVHCEHHQVCGDAGNFTIGPASPSAAPQRFRRFSVPGTYEYYSTVLGAKGRIIVKEDQ